MVISTVYTNTDLEMEGLCTNPYKTAVLRMTLGRFTRRSHRAFHCRSCCYPLVLSCVMCDLGLVGD